MIKDLDCLAVPSMTVAGHTQTPKKMYDTKKAPFWELFN